MQVRDIKNGFYHLPPNDQIEYERLVADMALNIRPPANINISTLTKTLMCLQEVKMRTMARLAREELEKDASMKIILHVSYYEVIDFLVEELKEFNPLETSSRINLYVRDDNISKFREAGNTYRLLINTPHITMSPDISFSHVVYMMPSHRISDNRWLNQIEINKFRFIYGVSSNHTKEADLLDELARRSKEMQQIHIQYRNKFPDDYESEYEEKM